MLLMIWYNFIIFVVLSFKLLLTFPVGSAAMQSHWDGDGGRVQLVGTCGRREAMSTQLSPPYHGRQLAPWSAPRLLRTEKENGAETKSSAPNRPLSAPKFAVITDVSCWSQACKINTMSGPVNTPEQITKTRVANVHFRPSFWTIAAREVRRRDLVSGTPFLSFRN